MDIMKPFLELTLLLSALFIASPAAQAAERFSVQGWKDSFSQALVHNDKAQIRNFMDFKALEKKAVPKCLDCDNKTKMHQARVLFAKGNYAAAEKIYNEIPKGSDAWLEAVEERGWSHFRRDDFEKTIAQTKTLLSPQFEGAVNSEAYFLQSLAQLRICDYEGILTTHQDFKEKQRNRIVEMQNLARTGTNEALENSIGKTDKFPLRYEDFGVALTKLPLLFYRDIEFQRQLLRLKISQAALTVIPDGKNLKIRSQFIKIKDKSAAKLKNRMKRLAQIENTENSRIIQKLNLVEIEAIQRIHTDMKLSDNMYKETHFKKVSEDQLIFMDDGQPWIDELDKYDVAAKTCIKNIRRKM